MPLYLDELLQAYEGEIAGEVYFKTLSCAFPEPGHQKKLMLLAEVERRTWKTLHPLITRYGLKPSDSVALTTRGEKSAKERDFPRWSDLMEAAGPDEDKSALKSLVEHEVALLSFAERETAGDTDSLSLVRQYLIRT